MDRLREAEAQPESPLTETAVVCALREQCAEALQRGSRVTKATQLVFLPARVLVSE